MATKRQELTDPDSCLGKAADDEPVFVLRAKDRLAPAVVRDWCQRARNSGIHEAERIEQANDWALEMERWRRENVGS